MPHFRSVEQDGARAMARTVYTGRGNAPWRQRVAWQQSRLKVGKRTGSGWPM